MTGRRNIIIASSAIVVFAAIVGFFITLDVSPQIAYARLFIDAGLVIGLMAVIMAFYREKELPTESITTALNSLKAGNYQTRLTATDMGQLNGIAQAINDLAAGLLEKHEKQEEIKRNLREELLPGLKNKDVTSFEHSLHPELGPVIKAIPSPLQQNNELRDTRFESMAPWPLKVTEAPLNNSLLGSDPPKAPEQPPSLAAKVDQDLGELYQRFIDAQRARAIAQIEYPTFLKTIEKTREDLVNTYHCQGVLFDIVTESNQVALQPKIIR